MSLLRLLPFKQPHAHHHLRLLHTTLSPQSTNFSRPSPPALPRAQQREFEDLQKRVNTPLASSIPTQEEMDNDVAELALHPDFRAKPKPTFEGERNPVTGEVGGPKWEPLEHGDWAYGGKVTDF
ncbi:hypothetical protein T439DRAFT_313872 [Meredithblackwellia eburnea MCA 4105]